MSQHEIHVGAVMTERLREARAARVATAVIRSRRARSRDGRLPRVTGRRTR